jgi:cytochrome b561
MIQFKNTDTHFGVVSIFFHWLMAILIICIIALGLTMTSISRSDFQFKLFRWHKELGILVLMLVVLRLIWRYKNKIPSLNFLPAWERMSARGVHWILYACMILMPITGWFMSSAAGISVSFFGLFVMPNFISPNEVAHEWLEDIHVSLAFFLIGVICLHTAAALKHYFIDKDEVMQRMLKP